VRRVLPLCFMLILGLSACEADPGGGSQATNEANCTSGYDPCLPPASDYDCAGGSGDGPMFASGVVRVSGFDLYGLDADGDGFGCE